LAHFSGLQRALANTFPDWNLPGTHLPSLRIYILIPCTYQKVPPMRDIRPRGFWADKDNKRKIILEFAQQQGFDPTQPANWTTEMNAKLRQQFSKLGLKDVLELLPEMQRPDICTVLPMLLSD